MILNVKAYIRRKSRPVIGGHIVDSYGHKVYARTMNSVLDRILMRIDYTNNFEFMMGDIEPTPRKIW